MFYKQFLPPILALGLALPAHAAAGNWQTSTTTSPLTNRETFSAILKSTNSVLNQIDHADNATLYMACGEHGPAFFVAWPQVLSVDNETVFLNLPQTHVLKKMDDGPIKSEFWRISPDRLSAGGFDKSEATRLIGEVAHGSKLVLRLGSQDAAFDLQGVDEIASQVIARCGLMPIPVPPSKGQADVNSPPALGVQLVLFSPELAKLTHQDGLSGVMIIGITPGSIAAKAGLTAGDIITSFNGVAIADAQQLLAQTRDAPRGQHLVIAVSHDEIKRQVTVQF